MINMVSEFDKKTLKLLKQNRREVNGFIYTLPSPENYPFQWLWDSCFHSIVLSYFEIEIAKAELFSLVSKQFENGLIPHMIYWEKPREFGTFKVSIAWGKIDTSSITQPPIIADAVLKVFETDHDKNFLKKIYPNLKRFYEFLLEERDVRGNHLIGLINPDESGEDNSPRFDIPLNLPFTHSLDENFKKRLELINENRTCNFEGAKCMRNFFWVKDAPFNVFMIKNLKSMSEIAQALGEKADSHFFIQEADFIEEAMRKYMFEDGIFWSIYQPNTKQSEILYKKIRVKTWAIFAPMYANILTTQEAAHLVEDHLLNKGEFWLTFPIPTTSFDEPSFDPEGFWRGPTWISTNWFIFHGLINYGFLDIAREIYKISKYLIDTEGFREQFNPITGKGEGASNFTWGSLIVDMEKTLEKFKN